MKVALQKAINALLGFYIAIFRGTPMIVQAMVFYYDQQSSSLGYDSLTAAFIIVSVNTGAYMAEVVRGGINSIDQVNLKELNLSGCLTGRPCRKLFCLKSLEI